MKKSDRNYKYGIESYGKEKWNLICDYEDDKETRKEKVFAEASKPENMNDLFSIINEFVGEDLKFGYTINQEKRRINIKSGVDLSNKPFICLAWKEFLVDNFNGGIGCDEPYYSSDRDYTKPVNKVYYWMDIHYSYQHHGGGSNGAQIGTAIFGEDGKWIFKPSMERC